MKKNVIFISVYKHRGEVWVFMLLNEDTKSVGFVSSD